MPMHAPGKARSAISNSSCRFNAVCGASSRRVDIVVVVGGAGQRDQRVDQFLFQHGLCQVVLCSVIQTPPLGRNVKIVSKPAVWPGKSCNRNAWTTVATTRTASIIAKSLPIHWCGPPRNGK